MTPLAAPAQTSPANPARRLARLPLAAKLAFGFIGLVALVLIVNGAVDAWLSYSAAKRAALEVQSEKARAAAERVGVFLDEIQTELGWTAGVEWGYAKLEQQRYDFIRLLRQAPAITALAYLDGKGKEQLAVSRLEPDAVASGKDFSADPRFVRAVADKVWFGPVEFRRGSEPYMTIALAHVGKTPGVTVADVNLKLVWDVVSAIHVGDKGFAYVVDDKGRLIAHPDLSLVLRDTDFSHLPQVAAALDVNRPGAAEVARSAEGAAVLTAYAIARKTHWAVFVEQPLAEALATAYRSLLRSLALLGLGLTLAAVSGVALARRMAAPIRALQAGAEKLGAGDLAQRLDIRTGDEIEALAGGFNRMAGQLQESYENLEGKVEARTRDLTKALARQTATAEILKVIASSPADAQPVFEAIVTSAKRLLGGLAAACTRHIDGMAHLAAFTKINPQVDAARAALFPRTDEVYLSQAEGRSLLIADAQIDERVEFLREYSSRMGFRGFASVPLMSQGRAIGGLSVTHAAIGGFGEADLELLRTFADQAVIAIENARLLSDINETLAQQTATADVLKIISKSIADAAPVFETILESCQRLFDPYGCAIYLVEGDMARGVARRGFEGGGDWGLDMTPLAESSTGRAIAERKAVHFRDLIDKEDMPERFKAVLRETGGMTVLYAPMLSGDRGIGSLLVSRRPKKPFSEAEIDFIQTFADQAVIAIENARLFAEVQARTRDLEDSLAQQTATADVLKVISRSAFDLETIFATLVKTAVALNDAFSGVICVRDGESFRYRASAGPGASQELHAWLEAHPATPGRGTIVGRTLLSGRVEQIPDVSQDAEYVVPISKMVNPARAFVGVPLQGKTRIEGALVLTHREPGGYSPRQIEILQTFADQAVIALENARLFAEVQAKTRDLSESLEYQTAISNVLGVISRSPNEVQPVFDTIVATARVLCLAERAVVWSVEGGQFRPVAFSGMDSSSIERIADHLLPTGSGSVAGQAAAQGHAVQLLDASVDPSVGAQQHELARAGNIRTILAAPLMSDGVATGCLTLSRAVAQRFDDRQVGLLQTFADQAVIAIKNVRLFKEVQARTRELEQSLSDLRKAQDRLVQSEKLASLGQLTAGIAHEIKNPLNFVNNFAALSRELLEELRETLVRLPDDARADADDLMGMIDSNLEKVASHGKRADSIVKNMLLHSREGSGERTRVNINAMVEEALNLGYHGARAEKPGFNVTIEKALDPDAGEADLYMQEVTRVLLNLISNGFYASAKRRQSEGPGYEPVLKASTRSLGASVEIRIRDNGTGIPDDVRAKMFNPFFTTKPAGEGTGLGLSLSHDIVVKQHGGSLDVETAPGAFTEFIITLPREGAKT